MSPAHLWIDKYKKIKDKLFWLVLTIDSNHSTNCSIFDFAVFWSSEVHISGVSW